MVMTLHRLSAGAGYQYLLKHTAAGDCDHAGVAPLTDYYNESGNPPGRWLGKGLLGVDLSAGALVTEATMANLFGAGRHPLTGQPLGMAYYVYAPPAERIAAQTATLPPELGAAEREAAVATITRVELARNRPMAVAGFDLTFTPTKSVSTLWAVADPGTQQAILDAHRAAVQDTLDFAEETAVFTRTGARGCMQMPVQGMLATAFDHWDSRAGDPTDDQLATFHSRPRRPGDHRLAGRDLDHPCDDNGDVVPTRRPGLPRRLGRGPRHESAADR